VLFDAAQFEPLIDELWTEGRVRDAIAAIVADADAAFDREALWPEHEWDDWRGQLPPKKGPSLYVGASGVIWGLDVLTVMGKASTFEGGADVWPLLLNAVNRRRRQAAVSTLTGNTPAVQLLNASPWGSKTRSCRERWSCSRFVFVDEPAE
jgi:hypothetical protein